MTWLTALVAIPLAISAVVGTMISLGAILAELRPRTKPATIDPTPSVSVIVPAYNEGVVLGDCIGSILNSGYPRLEVIVVNDGSTDNTEEVMERFSDRAITITQENGGKGSALNAGIERASGEILMFVDADGIFTEDTIPNMLAGFRNKNVGAVCGNDQPVNTHNVLTRILTLMTHTGTGLARRGVALLGMLPIVAGNSGAFRASAIRAVGGFRDDTLGEDLELTWRIQEAGYEVEFAPDAIVLAEVPDQLSDLWKQRVRWARGLIQTARVHRQEFLSPVKSMFHLYLPVNFFVQIIQPILQLLGMVGFPLLVLAGIMEFDDWTAGLPNLWLVLGFGVSAVNIVLALVLDRAWSNFRHLIVLPLLLPFSIFLSCVVVSAIWKEIRGEKQEWNKLERTGVKTRVEA
ncbi:cellulose synthase/poly-beta-1,6-N-acetylglucosamine synthase-like glycosyltransferase [Trueperella bonasi]|uniref:Cellulose synthase/poly-beta-1,6-N-acetylglucosamine synthase-like glycosyltransferase n=1 Tax=Trueperella bonasi TaxID=312286 RepID=A0ABT9NFX8_9ACTO|nr:glycosyltransferase family 2 protein [Trueperella bonasi]MDP9806300.1 cellulose synthase/poly-beta-1,6-N-acetylglucosamine synthase-like glycosyltransferase [Trueperella bonasi]